MIQGINLSHLSRTMIGSRAQEQRLNIIANNLANVGTAGFKKDVPVFEDFIIKETRTHFAQGDMEFTGNRLDVGLNGPGFFQIETPSGTRYTRNGSFTLTSTGELITLGGHRVVGGGAIPNDVKDLNITENGAIQADGTQVGQLEIVEFEDPNVLVKEGYTYFKTKAEGITGRAAEETTTAQFYLERSNVSAVQESVNLIDTVRTYEAFQKVIVSFEEADQKSINEVGRLV